MNFNAKTYEEIDYDYCRASSGLRFSNYIIDMVFFYILMFSMGVVIGIANPNLLDAIDDGIISRLIGLVFYGVIMSFTEAMTNGKSIGKFITKTKVVNLDGSDISLGKAFSRNMIRAIPFNAFSGLGNPCMPWHDKWSDTMVIEEKKVALQKQKAILFDSVKNQTQ